MRADERETYCACTLRMWCEVCAMASYVSLWEEFEDECPKGCSCGCVTEMELEWQRFAANQNISVRVPVIPRAA